MSLQNDYFSENTSSEEDNNGLLNTHRCVITENGRTLYIPKEYNDYDDLKTKHLETVYFPSLLLERLCLLIYYKKIQIEEQKDPSDTLSFIKEEILFNQISLFAQAPKGFLDIFLFGEDIFTDQIKFNDHMIYIAVLLKKRINNDFQNKISVGVTSRIKERISEDFLQKNGGKNKIYIDIKS